MIPNKTKRSAEFVRGYQSGFGAGEKSAARAKPRKVAELLNEILDFQVANRGCDPARNTPFYKCFTGEMPAWVSKAEKLLKELTL